MKYLRKFETEAEKDAWLNSAEHVKPNVVLIGEADKVEYNIEVDYSIMPLHVKAIEDLAISFGNDYEYSRDNVVWNSGTSSTAISALAGERVFFRASGLTPNSSNGIGTFTISNGTCNVGGNVMSMVYADDYKDKTEITAKNQFAKLFYGASTVVDASALVLPATKLASGCYLGMLLGCTSLVNAPTLPATTLESECYKSMFYGCTSLVNAPTLPATTLANYCYKEMFYNCSSLVNAPTLPATTLKNYCYDYMFHGCTSLVNAPTLPATTLVAYCYNSMFRGCTSLVNAPTLPATTLEGNCYTSMFQGCTSLVNAPTLPATTLKNYCYQSMFYGCKSLVNAPELPATNLAYNCYGNMFYNCSKLSYVKAMFTTAPSSSYTSNWLLNVAAEGTFVKNAAATWNVTGANGIPSGWTVETAAA